MDHALKKMLQKRLYDLLSHKYGIMMVLAAFFLLALSAFHFGQAWLEWSQDKYEAVFNSFSDNISGKSFRERLTAPLPIDVVYTWVNGTDPELIRQLEMVKVSLDRKSNLSREERCTYTNCVPVGILLSPPVPSSTRLKDVTTEDRLFENITSVRDIRQILDGPVNFTLLGLENEAEVKNILKAKVNGWTFQGNNHTLKPAYYTSDSSLPHGLLMPELIMMSGFPSQYGLADVQQAVAGRLNVTDKTSVDVKLYTDKGVALLQLGQSSHYDLLVKDKNFTIEGKVIRLSSVKLVWDLKFAVTDDVVAASRFEDNEELRYSLRSIEKFAPWVRHIYIVTNGQIPYWLNLDSSRLTVITHDEIFQNLSHLPTFSSPAIEANIHKIPGLSDKFLYLNDDVMFGSPVWPDDFYSHSTGQKLYLTWPVPNCNEGCPSTWIRDGYCDKACNSSECDWDGGDCVGAKGRVQLGAGFHGDRNQFLTDYISYCSTGCANNWLADKYCDQACNNLDCGFDIGDCGVGSYDKLYELQLHTGQAHYVLPQGELIGYFNISGLLGDNGKVKSAKYEPNTGIRAAAVSNKFKVMTLVLNKDVNATTLKFYLDYHKGGNDTFQVNLTVGVDTSVPKAKINVTLSPPASTENPADAEDRLDAVAFQPVIHAFPRGPSASMKLESSQMTQTLPEGIDLDILKVFTHVTMSERLKRSLQNLQIAHQEGELTEFGINIRLHQLVEQFGLELQSLKPEFDQQKLNWAKEEQDRKLREERKSLQNASIDSALASFREMPEPRPDIPAGAENKSSLLVQALPQQQFDSSDTRQREVPPVSMKQKLLSQFKLFPRNDVVGQVNVPGKASETLQSKQGRLGLMPQLKKTSGGISKDTLDVPIDDARMPNGNKDNPHAARRKLLGLIYETDSLDTNPNLRGYHQKTPTGLESLGSELSDEYFVKMVSVEAARSQLWNFPWEKDRWDQHEQELRERAKKANGYVVEGWQGRQLLDTFGDSLRHVNRIYNKEFGVTSRKVPGHMPHMIDKNIMQELQDRFPEEWDETSSHKIRSSTDMQYGFAYYYYLMGVTKEITAEDVFSMMDSDQSGVLSDREIRTLAARMYDLPLYLEILTGLEAIFVNCSKQLTDPTLPGLTESQQEVYYDKNMPQITKYLFLHCDELVSLIKEKFKPVPKYKTTIVDDADISFKMIHTNVSHVVGQLDDIRKHPKKFICLNDNIDHTREEARTVKAILQDFYESLVPTASQFELPRDYRNRFLHMDELREWRVYRDRLRMWTHIALTVLVFLTAVSFLGEKIENLRRKWFIRKRRHRQGSVNSDSPPVSSQEETPPSSPRALFGRQPRRQEMVETV